MGNPVPLFHGRGPPQRLYLGTALHSSRRKAPHQSIYGSGPGFPSPTAVHEVLPAQAPLHTTWAAICYPLGGCRMAATPQSGVDNHLGQG